MPAHSASVLLFCWSVLAAPILCAEKNQSTPQKDTFTFESHVDVVLVPVVVRDREGRLVGDLTQRDFQVFDNNKRQVISGFMLATVAPPHSTQKAFEDGPHGTETSPRRFVILLFDDLHVTFSDLARSKESAKRVLGELNGSGLSAVVSLSGLVNSGMTADEAILLKALDQIQPHTVYQKSGTDCPDMDYHQAELIVNEHDAVALQAATEEVLNCNPSLDTPAVAERLAEHAAERVFALGEQDNRVSLASLQDMVKKTAVLPGLSTLILISPGFPTRYGTSKTRRVSDHRQRRHL